MRENNLPGSTPATMNSTKTMSIGTHKVSNVKSEDNCTESKSSIRSLVLKIIKRGHYNGHQYHNPRLKKGTY